MQHYTLCRTFCQEDFFKGLRRAILNFLYYSSDKTPPFQSPIRGGRLRVANFHAKFSVECRGIRSAHRPERAQGAPRYARPRTEKTNSLGWGISSLERECQRQLCRTVRETSEGMNLSCFLIANFLGSFVGSRAARPQTAAASVLSLDPIQVVHSIRRNRKPQAIP